MQSDKYYRLYKITNHWLSIRERGIYISDYLQKIGVKSIGIYGGAALGRHLFWDMQHGNIIVDFIVDRRENLSGYGVPVINFEKEKKLPETDMIIVTVMDGDDIIEKNVCSVSKTRVVHLEDVINNADWRKEG